MSPDWERAATPEEITAMRALARKAMEDGAFGMSSGLEYVPAIWSTTDELVALLEEITPLGRLLPGPRTGFRLHPDVVRAEPG